MHGTFAVEVYAWLIICQLLKRRPALHISLPFPVLRIHVSSLWSQMSIDCITEYVEDSVSDTRRGKEMQDAYTVLRCHSRSDGWEEWRHPSAYR
jgi:hypothetical protein